MSTFEIMLCYRLRMRYLNFSNSLKMYLIFPVISFTFLNFLKLLLVPMQITFRFMDLIKNNKK